MVVLDGVVPPEQLSKIQEELQVLVRPSTVGGVCFSWFNHPEIGLSIAMGVPHSWMVFVRENSYVKWMMTGGTPICGNPQMEIE